MITDTWVNINISTGPRTMCWFDLMNGLSQRLTRTQSMLISMTLLQALEQPSRMAWITCWCLWSTRHLSLGSLVKLRWRHTNRVQTWPERWTENGVIDLYHTASDWFSGPLACQEWSWQEWRWYWCRTPCASPSIRSLTLWSDHYMVPMSGTPIRYESCD